jgi:hypothetical protein
MAHDFETQRRAVMLGLAAAGFGGGAYAQSTAKVLEDLARAALARGAANASTGQTSSVSSIPSNLSIGEADGGLRQALTNAAVSSALRLGRLDGYWADGKVRIPLPSPLSTLQARFRPLNLSKPLDSFQMRLNRAAETAVPRAGAIFTDTIKSITIADAIQIVRGGDTAGTDMLKARATTQLTSLLTPPMADAVESSGAGATLDRINARYGREIERLGGLGGLSIYEPAPLAVAQTSGPLIFGAGATTTPAQTSTTTPASPATTAAPSNPSNSLKNQLIGFAVSKALDGLFLYIGEEERAIRRDPVKRTTDLLKRVFGG